MTKIDIVSGFLGAGKTTLIKKMLEEVFSGEKVVLVENEYGEVGIDGGFLKDSGIEIRELNSGCICCSLVGDFSRSLKEVIETYHPDRILIEPSGVGKLSDVMSSVKKMEGDYGDVKLNALVTVANAMKVSKQMKPEFSSVIRMQDSLRKPPSTPISPNSFSISTSLSPVKTSRISFLIRVVLPAPRKPEKISILVIFLPVFLLVLVG